MTSLLSELSIKNFAIIDDLTVSFDKGMTVLTGETGAGKSIIIDAIQLLIGGRGSADFVRHGENKAELEGLFHIEKDDHPCYEKLAEFGLTIDDNMLVIRREISHTGKSVCRINGKLVTIAIVREIGNTLVDIHGQHEHHLLMDQTLHLSLLDQFAAANLTDSLQEYKSLYKKYRHLHNKFVNFRKDEQQIAHRLDLIKFQYDEITAAQLQPKEEEELVSERNELNNYEKIFEALQTSYSALQGEHKGLDWVGLAMTHLENIGHISNEYKKIKKTAANSYYMLEDVSHTIRNLLDELSYNPDRLNEIENRLSVINQLKRKYGQSITEILEYSSKIEEEIELLENRETHYEQLEQEVLSVKKDLQVEADQLTKLRQQAAQQLETEIHRQLEDLYMEKTTFAVKFFKTDNDFTETGADKVEFYIATNPGEPLKPLSRIASGGELSRIMLAIKNIFSKHQGVTSIIFDEVDSGVSGRVAQAIAEKIYRVSIGSQVLCISHLPQVAAMSDTHLLIAKNIAEQRTYTSVRPLNDEEKVAEISRMISGVEVTELTTEHANELLTLANNIKLMNITPN